MYDPSEYANLAGILDLSSLPEQHTRVLFVKAERVYVRPRTTYWGYDLTQNTWLNILNAANIPPNAVELLHDTKGAYWSCLIYCAKTLPTSANNQSGSDRACAYHVALRLCKWLGKEQFLHSRKDFRTGKSLVLLVGMGKSSQITQLQTQFSRGNPPHLFSVICAIITCWINEIATIGWDLDFATQRLESETGFANRFFQEAPLPAEQLTLRKGLVITRENLYGACRATEIMRDISTFLGTELSNNGTFRQGRGDCQSPNANASNGRLESQLARQLQQHAVQQDSQHVQLMSLVRRVDAQWQITTALMSQHNTNLTIQMAKDSRNDSVLMRRIAFVTIIFLPATFMATFFSMSFFHVSEGHLTVSSWIWLYAVCTAPLTIFLAMAYGDIGERWKRWQSSFKSTKRNRFKEKEGIFA